MAEWHLNELRNAIERSGWRFVVEHPSEDIYVSATWEFKRGESEPNLLIDFGGIDDLKTLPIEESYGCKVRGDATRSLYFRRKRQHDIWLTELRSFVSSLNNTK